MWDSKNKDIYSIPPPPNNLCPKLRVQWLEIYGTILFQERKRLKANVDFFIYSHCLIVLAIRDYTLLKMNKEIVQLLSMGDSPQAQKHVSKKKLVVYNKS